MTTRYNSQILGARDEIVAPPTPRACEDHSFELPTGIYVAMGLLFFGFVSVLSFAFMGPTMVVPYGVFVAFIAAFFAVPTIFARSAPEGERKELEWDLFLEKGIQTATGRTGAFEATVLALLLPFLILCFGIAVVTIAALV